MGWGLYIPNNPCPHLRQIERYQVAVSVAFQHRTDTAAASVYDEAFAEHFWHRACEL